jgi:hypothetical protein
MFRIGRDERCLFKQRGGGDQAIGQGDRSTGFSKISLEFGGFFSDGAGDGKVHKPLQQLSGRWFFRGVHSGKYFSDRHRRTAESSGRLQLAQISLKAGFLAQMVDQDIAIEDVSEHGATGRFFDPGADFEYTVQRPFSIQDDLHATKRRRFRLALSGVSAVVDLPLPAQSEIASVVRREPTAQIADTKVREKPR